MHPHLQALQADPRWFTANSDILDAAIAGAGCHFGPRGRIIRRAAAILLPAPWLLLLFMRMLGLCFCIGFCFQARRRKALSATGPSDLFVVFSAGSEAAYWARFRGIASAPIRLDQTRPTTFGEFSRTAYRPVLTMMWREAATCLAALLNTQTEPVGSRRLDYITHAIMRLPTYSFHRAWWVQVPKSRVRRVVFLTPDTPAFACIDAGVPDVMLWQHGLQKRNLIVPPFHVMETITRTEQQYYDTILTSTAVTVQSGPEQAVTSWSRSVLFASSYDSRDFRKSDFEALLREIVDFCRSEGLKVVVRLHPVEDDDFWSTRFPELVTAAPNQPFAEHLLELRPLFVISWFSTTLVEALVHNVVPITINDDGDAVLASLVVDLRQHCLMWPTDRDEIRGLMHGAAQDIQETIERLG